MLLVDWFTRLAREAGLDLPQRNADKRAFLVGPPDGFHVVAAFTDQSPFLTLTASDATRQEEVNALSVKAGLRVAGGDFGGVVWHSGVVREIPFTPSPSSFIGPLLQRMGSQQRILGWRRLGPSVLLEFVEEPFEAGKDHLFAPNAEVLVHIAAPGPCEGHLSHYVASKLVETIAAICTFALGRPVAFSHTMFPSPAESRADLDQRRADPAVLTLARKGVSLDIFSLLGVPGGLQVFHRARAALLTYDAATRQDRDAVAAILYVVAAEGLTVPNAAWKRERLTTRFIRFFDDMMPSDLDRLVNHGNFEEAFEIKRGHRSAGRLRKEALDRFYAYRSGEVHEGLGPSYQILGPGGDEKIFLRRGLLGDFAEAAILRYLSAPRSSLIGHPGFQLSNPSESEA
jgi:hypothetical protein